ncbi:YadA-like family protein, partial [Veillonella sp. 3627]|uniref:YadA-like family protein n=1 Tax=Veillonella sp. 3627 TaxID=2490953 RepID=UPI00197F7FFE
KDLIFNATDPKTGVEKTSHVSGDKIGFTTTDEMEKVFDKDGKPVIDPATGKQKEVIKNPGNSTEYTNEGLKVIPNSTVARDVNGNLTFKDEKGEPVMKDKDGNFVYMDKDGKPKPGEKYAGAVGALKPNVVDNTRVISFGMDKPVLDSNGNPVKGPDGKPVMTEGISAGMQQIHNVAPGTKDTDAVNVSQLRGTTININNRMNRMGAQAAAMAGLRHLQYDPLEPTTIMAGIGTYKGEGALALGIAHYKNESTLFHAGASIGSRGEELMANAGVSWKFGARADETAVKDTFRQGPISASYTLQDKVSALEAQNQIQKDQLEEFKVQNKIQKDQLEELKALNEKQQAQIAELFKRIGEKI